MAREVTKPRHVKITHQVINQWLIALQRDPETKVVDFEASTLIYTVVDLTEHGIEIRRQEKRVPLSTWKPELLAEVKAIHNRLLQNAEESNLLDAGVDVEDLPEPKPQKGTSVIQ